ncbi:type II secretion system F family protein [Alicyclobacillus sp.]|uniref:type II secretion system F family protein n=1 Tax=Alicyclobacillus sp. TaxID=61169 RepID=UPI0025C4822D|nr:type II secretion system F family protein [Alicyclobacillus sp.]MCL6517842.1 type II secretion system F family protein [Alicyclobacillus sp.]
MTTALVFGTTALWFYLVLRAWAVRDHAHRERLRLAAGRPAPGASTAQGAGRPSRLRRWAGRIAARWRPPSAHALGERWDRAGAPGGLAPPEWWGLRLLLAGIGGTVGACMGVWRGGAPGLTLFAAVAALSWIGPEFWLSRRIARRQTDLLRMLPSALDLLTVSVEAGLGFDQALARVAERMRGPLAEEFGRVLQEVRLGSPRAAALQRMADRTGVAALGTFVVAVVQAERLGTGLAGVLRVQAAEVRQRRRMEAEERAQKAPVKMLFPLVLFVFPALFIVLLGPAVIEILGVLHGSSQ